MNELNLENAYDAEAFEKYKEYYVECFREENISEEEEKEISFGYRIKSVTYIMPQKGYELYAYKQYLYDAKGEEVCTWFVYDTHDFLNFSDVFMHSDGEKYFIYKECLYGYSVLRLSDLKLLHYVPYGQVSQNEPMQQIGESFIMTDFYYNNETDMIATNGCFWAAPTDVVVIDFKQPLAEPKKMLTFHKLIDPNYENDDLEDVEFKHWDKDELIVQTGNGQEFRFSGRDLK